MKKKVIRRKFGVNFFSGGWALTLSPCEVSGEKQTCAGMSERNHRDGWKIKGEIHEDYYYWVNAFEASHKKYGRVWGNFESIVYANSERGFNHFYKHHPPNAWDYRDI